MKLKHLAFFTLGIAIVTVYISINPSEVDFLPKCPLFAITGIFCPGCGSQRATHQLLQCNFLGVANQNILFVLGILLFSYHFIISSINKLFKKNKYNYLYHPKTPVIVLIIILTFWVLRNIPAYPFNLLAPN